MRWLAPRCLPNSQIMSISIVFAMAAAAAAVAATSTSTAATTGVNSNASSTPSETNAPPKIQQLYEAIINTDSIDENTVLYGVPTSIAQLDGDRMFLLNLSFVASNVTEAKLHFYHKSLSQFRFGTARNVRVAVYPIGKNGQLLRNMQYIALPNLTQPGWTEVDFTDVLSRILKSNKRQKQLSVALQFEQEQRNGKMHQVAPSRFMIKRNGPYIILSAASTDTSNFYNWFEAMLKSGSAVGLNANMNPNSIVDENDLAETATATNEEENGSDKPLNRTDGSGNRNETQSGESQADSPFANLFGLPLYGRNERICSVRPWTVAVPRFLRKYIIHPKTLPLNRCGGSCTPGVSPEDFRNSLIARTYFDQLVRGSRLQKCCVPDKLGPLEMVFLSSKDSQYVVSRVSMPNLVAESCKCVYSYST